MTNRTAIKHRASLKMRAGDQALLFFLCHTNATIELQSNLCVLIDAHFVNNHHFHHATFQAQIVIRDYVQFL